ncbi:unnamed protein product [Prunus armeniaca]
MMQWQVNRQFRKDREAAIARISNPYVVIAGVPGQGEIHARQREGAFPDQEHEASVPLEGLAPIQVPYNSLELPPIPRPVVPRDQLVALLLEQPTVLP